MDLNEKRHCCFLTDRNASKPVHVTAKRRAMGKISFDLNGDRFEMVLEGAPQAASEHESVVATLPIYVPGEPQRVAHARVSFSLQQGHQLVGQLEAALEKARRPAK